MDFKINFFNSTSNTTNQSNIMPVQKVQSNPFGNQKISFKGLPTADVFQSTNSVDKNKNPFALLDKLKNFKDRINVSFGSIGQKAMESIHPISEKISKGFDGIKKFWDSANNTNISFKGIVESTKNLFKNTSILESKINPEAGSYRVNELKSQPVEILEDKLVKALKEQNNQ